MATVHESTNTVQFDQALRDAANRAKACYPEQTNRIERGLKIALAGDVDLLPSGMALIRSQTGTTVYKVNGRCECLDEPKAPKGYCKHRWAKSLHKAALAEQARHLPRDRWYATYAAPDGTQVPGIAEWHEGKQCWLFIPEDGRDPLFPSLCVLSLGGHVPTEQEQRLEDGNLAAKFGAPQYDATYADAAAAIAAAKANLAAYRKTRWTR